VSDLTEALREAGQEDVAAALERKELAGRLRTAGRDDLADMLVTGEQPPPAAQPEPVAEPEPEHELLAKQLDKAQSRWVTLSGEGGSDGEAG
jgi:hypothetical protein